MDLQLTDQVAVVVGAASGIGRAIAETFAAEGAHVALLDLSPGVVDLAQQIAGQHQVKTLGLVSDVTDFTGLTVAAEQISTSLGRVDQLVYAAGLAGKTGGFPFWNLQPSEWPRLVEVNLIGAVNALHAFVPDLTQGGKGRGDEERSRAVLFVSSVAGQIGSQTDPPYSASKAGLINFSQCAAKDLAPYRVRVNALCPGMVETPLNMDVWRGQMSNLPESERVDYATWAAEKIAKVVPLNRWQTPQDIADMAVFLASERARNVTGQTINVDGGFVMHW
ncbi:MAG: SDR family oxidoreductase [Caldilineaceae bacterium]|nr:SDR family oxidoreductase [Caldilineaceae bacterium]